MLLPPLGRYTIYEQTHNLLHLKRDFEFHLNYVAYLNRMKFYLNQILDYKPIYKKNNVVWIEVLDYFNFYCLIWRYCTKFNAAIEFFIS